MHRKEDGVQHGPPRPAGFVQVRRDFVRDRNLSAEAKLVGVVMASYANGKGLAWPSVDTLKELTRLGENRVRRGRGELARAGYIRPVQERGKITRARSEFRTIRFEVMGNLLHRKSREDSKNAASIVEMKSIAPVKPAKTHDRGHVRDHTYEREPMFMHP